MRRIRKGRGPNSLTSHCKTLDASYDNYPHKDDLRMSLVNEQGYICCYCMSRIKPTKDDMKIEHCKSRAKHQNLDLDYKNLLGACLGGKEDERKNQHCDTYKGKKPLSFNPADSKHNIERHIKFSNNGTIKSDDSKIDRDMNKVLNLNHPQLVRNRRSALRGFLDGLERREKKEGKSVTDNHLKKKLKDFYEINGDQLEPFCQIVVYYLRKRLKVKV